MIQKPLLFNQSTRAATLRSIHWTLATTVFKIFLEVLGKALIFADLAAMNSSTCEKNRQWRSLFGERGKTLVSPTGGLFAC